MRNLLEDASMHDPDIRFGLKFGVKIQGAIGAGGVTLTAKDPTMQYLALAAAANVNMPNNVKGLTFIVVNNSGAANTITIKDSDAATTRGTIAQNAAAIVTSDGTRWWVLPLT